MSAQPKKNIFTAVVARVHVAVDALAAEGVLPGGLDLSRILVEPPREAAHGDMATNAAMVLAKPAGKKPRDLAEAIAAKLRGENLIEDVAVAGPGFINLTLARAAWIEELRAALAAGRDYGRSDTRRGGGGARPRGGAGPRLRAERHGARRASQRGIRFDQSDRPDTRRPRPRRGVRRRPCQSAGVHRPSRDARV